MRLRQRSRTIAQSAGPGKREGNHQMKITRVRATPVNVPLEAACVWSYGALPGFTQTIIEVETDEGLTGIGEAPSAAACMHACMHLCASQSWITKPNQSLRTMQPHDVIEEGPFRPKNNVVRVPEGPGPGVTLFRDKLKFLHQHFLDNGVMNKYHNPADPGRFVRLPLV